MKPMCAACNQEISKSRQIQCTLCKALFHLICVNLMATDSAKMQDWQCPECLAKQPKKGNSFMRVSGSPGCFVATVNTPPRATKRQAISSPNLSPSDNNRTDVASELRLLREDMLELKNLLTDSMSRCFERLEKFEQRIIAVEENIALISPLQGIITQLQAQLDNQMQNALKNELEIMGIEEETNENLTHIVLLTASKAGVGLVENDIDWVTRVGPKIGTNSAPISQRPGLDLKLPRPIIVRLTRKWKRDELLRGAKNRRNLSSVDITAQGPERKIYINEHLTKSNRKLFRDARIFAKDNGFRFCWISNGRVHVRKGEGRPAITINSSADLDKLRAPFENNN